MLRVILGRVRFGLWDDSEFNCIFVICEGFKDYLEGDV